MGQGKKEYGLDRSQIVICKKILKWIIYIRILIVKTKALNYCL